MLEVHRVADQMVDVVVPVIDGVERRDRPLADQLRRALQSVVLNIAEGEKVSGGNQRLGFERAAGSNAESRAAVRIAAKWGYIDPGTATAFERLADQLAAMLWRLTHR